MSHGTHPLPMSPLVSTQQCTHLRHKGMYVMSLADPCEAEFCGRDHATVYWCTQTMKGLGPDGQPVHADRCRSECGRACCAS